jgi:hypothetical protein
MKTNMLRIITLSLLAAAIAVAPSKAQGQETEKGKPAVEKKEPPKGEKKKGVPPLVGKLAAVDKTAKTITIGQSTVQITSETKIEKAGKPATLDDAVVGEEAMVRYKKTEDGKMEAIVVRLGPKPAKPEGEAGGEKKKSKE